MTDLDSRSVYQQAGVDIAAKMAIIAQIKAAAASTYTTPVLSGVGGFGGLYQTAPDSILVASTDGIGTKTMLAAQYGRYRGLGHDIVNHCINDILCQGAHPLFFLDYIAANRLDSQAIAEIVEGMAEACKAAGCALLGGETAEMPGVYQPGQFDVAGTIVGMVNPAERLPKAYIQAGDVIIGLESSGPHTNGYSLIRCVFADGSPEELIDAALAPHRSYLRPLGKLRAALPIKALAHITGGGFFDNIPRILPPGLGALIRRGSWPIAPIFQEIARRGNVSETEMYHVFNMGIGMVIILAADVAQSIDAGQIGPFHLIGEIVAGAGVQLA
ncbi:MAG: phosphoribosylformylglycinamidine cyclo-ligase [Aggregatilineales bacterium]